jgi:DNA-binding MarR family transcriptional regulator
MPLERDLRRVESALEQLARLGRSRRGDALREARSGVRLPRATQLVLRRVAESGPQRVSEIARALRMGDAAVSRHVTALEAGGLLTRSGSPDDGRVAVVATTAAGQRAHRKLRDAADGIFREHLAGWGSRDLSQLAALMERLVADLRAPLPGDEARTGDRAAEGRR